MADWECAACGKAIGVFEPLVLVGRSGERVTSRADEPDLEPSEGQPYHRHCHVLASGRGLNGGT